MNPTENALLQYFAQRCPWWGNCHFRWESVTKTLYIHSENCQKRRRILGDLQSFPGLDLGIAYLVLVQPPYADTPIDCLSQAPITLPLSDWSVPGRSSMVQHNFTHFTEGSDRR